MVKWLVIAVLLMLGTGATSAQVADSGLQNVADPEASAGPNAPQTSVDVSEAPAADDPAPKTVRTGSEDSGSGARAGKASAYNRGRLDRQAWQVWFAAQSGDTHAGAAYWVSNRSVAKRRPCASFANQSTDWVAGCKAGAKMLAPWDRQRIASRRYRQGWNSIPDPAPEAAPVQTPQASPSGNGTFGVLVAILMAVALFVIYRGRQKKPKSAWRSALEPAGAAPPALRPSPPLSPATATATAPQRVTQDLERWIRPGEVVTVAGVEITGGFIYLGNPLPGHYGVATTENCLIVPSLTAKPAAAGDPASNLNYWPSYSRLPEDTRYAYLQWLAGPRSDPTTNVGYVFLYFYGLERRLMAGARPNDRDAVIHEIERLQALYGANGSFRGYSKRLLDAAKAQTLVGIDIEPSFERSGTQLPLRVAVGLGKFVQAGQSIPAEWMLAWVMSDPMLFVGSGATRDFDRFKELFCQRWDRIKPDGVRFTANQISRFPTLEIDYRAASGSFSAKGAVDGVPDVTSARQVAVRAHSIATACCEELDTYTRLVARRPELKGSIAAAANLPPELDAFQKAQVALSALEAMGGLHATDLLAAIEGRKTSEADRVTPSQWKRAGDLLGKLGFGLAPDPQLSLQRASPDTPARVYALPPGSAEVPPSMQAASLSLQIGALVAKADGHVSPEERAELLKAVEASGLDQRQRARLAAQVEWMLATTVRPTELKSKLATVPEEGRAHIAELALSMVRLGGRISAAEVKQLEKVFAWLGLPASQLYGGLTEIGTVEITAAAPTGPGQAIPQPKPTRPTFDKDRIARISAESAQSAQLLNAVFGGDAAEEVEIPLEPQALQTEMVFAGLSPAMADFARTLCARPSWGRAELEAMAKTHSLMLEGSIERLNDWAIERFGDLLIENGDPTLIVQDLLQQPVSA